MLEGKFVVEPEHFVEAQLKNYHLVEFIKGGGFGWVYKATHVKLQKTVAIKLLNPRHVLKKGYVEAFEREAKIIASLQHPHILDVYDYDVFHGLPFIVMPFVEQGSMRTLHPAHSVLDTATIISYVKQIASALQYAHDHKIVHRDVKPENVLRGPQGLLLSDFGIAITAHSIDSLSTQDSNGTVFYMAPEQHEHRAQVWSDQYSLAVVVYEWLCGKRPFDGTSRFELYRKHKEDTPPSFKQQGADVPQAVEQVIMRALAKDPQRRFASVQDFATALEQALKPMSSPASIVPLHPQPELAVSPEPAVLLKLEPSPASIVPPHPQPEPAVSPKPVILPPREQQTQPVPSQSQTQPALVLQPHPQQSQPVAVPQPVAPPPRPAFIKHSLLQRKAVFFVVLAFLIVGSASLIYYSTRTSTTHLQTTALATASPYDKFVAANGMMFGFGAAHTHFNQFEKVLTPANVSKLVQAWTYPTVGIVNTSLVVVNAVVYFGSTDDFFYALDARSGAKLWSYKTGGAIDSSPAVANGVVYFGSKDQSFYALDARSGAKLWSYKTGSAIDSSPTVVDGMVYFGSGGTLYALNARSGSELWSYKVGGNITSSPAVIGGIVCFGSLYQYYDHHTTDFYALDARSGSKLWSFQSGSSGSSSGVNSSPAVVNGVVYFGSVDHSLYALDARSGNKLWNFTTGSDVSSSPAVVNGVVYFGSEDNSQLLKNSDFAFMGSGILFALDIHSGSKLWSFQTGLRINSSPAVVNGVVYFGSLDGRLYAFYLGSK